MTPIRLGSRCASQRPRPARAPAAQPRRRHPSPRTRGGPRLPRAARLRPARRATGNRPPRRRSAAAVADVHRHRRLPRRGLSHAPPDCRALHRDDCDVAPCRAVRGNTQLTNGSGHDPSDRTTSVYGPITYALITANCPEPTPVSSKFGDRLVETLSVIGHLLDGAPPPPGRCLRHPRRRPAALAHRRVHHPHRGARTACHRFLRAPTATPGCGEHRIRVVPMDGAGRSQ